jgi:anti-sigma regulatory factor (Ser/Thr protein kinase)
MIPAPEYLRIEIRLPNDPRAFPALEATIEHLGQRAGMSDSRQRALARAVRETCRAAFAGRQDGSLGIRIEGYDDRVEVRVESAGAGLRPPGGKKAGALARISRVAQETADGVSRLVLVQQAKSGE